MHARSLGPSATAVSAIGFGAMRLSVSGRPPEDVSLRVLAATLDAGVTLIDTADVYDVGPTERGHNERLIARALRMWAGPRDRVVVATKGLQTRPGGQWGRDARPAYLREACERSLRALGRERIDLYLLHCPDPSVPFGDTLGALAELQREGKIRWIGLSNVLLDHLRAAERIVQVTTVENRLNPFFREDLGNGVLDYCQQRGIGYLAYSPVGGPLHQELVRHATLLSIAQAHGVSASATIVAWLLGRAPNIIPIPSARAAERVLDCVSAADLTLAPAEMAALDRWRPATPGQTFLERIKVKLREYPLVAAAYRRLRNIRPV